MGMPLIGALPTVQSRLLQRFNFRSWMTIRKKKRKLDPLKISHYIYNAYIIIIEVKVACQTIDEVMSSGNDVKMLYCIPTLSITYKWVCAPHTRLMFPSNPVIYTKSTGCYECTIPHDMQVTSTSMNMQLIHSDSLLYCMDISVGTHARS